MNIFLFGTIILCGVCIVASTIVLISLKVSGGTYHGTSSLILYSSFFVFFILLILSKFGNSKFSAYAFISIYSAFAIYISLKWGVYSPQGLLIFALIIIMSGILIGTKFLTLFSIFSIAVIYLLFHLQSNKILSFDSSWMNRPIDIWDITVYIATLFVIYIASWLFNREIIKSLKRARKSEAALKSERDSLEIKVAERTEELRKAQYEKMRQLYRFAEFGRLSSGLFHDLTNYLTALSLNLEKAKTDVPKESVNTYVQKAFSVSNKIEDFVEAMQKQLQKQEVNKDFSVKKEFAQVIQLFSYRAKKEKINVLFQCKSDFLLFGNPLKFNQVITNILSNALDSFIDAEDKLDKSIKISLNSEQKNIVISVEDNGCGISERDMIRIFDPFFTTKDPDYGTGIGLSTTKEIVENSFQGKIEVNSKENQGTTVKIVIPKKWNERNNK